MPPSISVVIPVYNEAATLRDLLAKVRAVPLDCEIILVDDCSTDGTTELLKGFNPSDDLSIAFHQVNQGKGAALRTGFALASAKIVIIQDADLEYDPNDYLKLIAPIQAGFADVVFGSRFLPDSVTAIPAKSYWANRLITTWFNWLHWQRLTDVETCYKAFRLEVLQSLAPSLTENRFGIEIELTAKICKLTNIRILELPIRYTARSYQHGKKIGFKDGLRALWCIVRFRWS